MEHVISAWKQQHLGEEIAGFTAAGRNTNWQFRFYWSLTTPIDFDLVSFETEKNMMW